MNPPDQTTGGVPAVPEIAPIAYETNQSPPPSEAGPGQVVALPPTMDAAGVAATEPPPKPAPAPFEIPVPTPPPPPVGEPQVVRPIAPDRLTRDNPPPTAVEAVIGSGKKSS